MHGNRTPSPLPPLRATDYTLHWQKSKVSAPRSSSSSTNRRRLEKPAWNRAQSKKKSQTIDRPSRLHFTVYLFNHDYPLNDQVYSGRIKRFLRRKASDFKREHRKLTARPSDQGVARSSFLSCFLTWVAHQDLIFFRVVSWFHFKDN